MKLEHNFFHECKLSEDQKKGFHRKLKRVVVKTKNKDPNIIQRSDADYSQIIGGDKFPHSLRVLAPLLAMTASTSPFEDGRTEMLTDQQINENPLLFAFFLTLIAK